MFHSIISDYDVFFAGNEGEFDPEGRGRYPDFGSAAAINGHAAYVPSSVAASFSQGYFSTNPDDYLKQIKKM